MPFPTSMLESRLDLSMARIEEPGHNLIVVSSRMTAGGAALAGAFALASMLCLFSVWRTRGEGWLWALWPWGLLAPLFAAVAVGIAFGHQQKAFDGAARKARIAASLGLWHAERSYPLPDQGVVRISFRKDHPSTANLHTNTPTRWYDVDVAGSAPLGFTIATDREAARSLAHRIALVLGYEVTDDAENDGVERRPGP